MASEHNLPDEFAELEPFVAYWSVSTTQGRRDQREAASMAEIQNFYDAMLKHAPAAIAYLEPLGLSGLDPKATHLMQLVLALAHVSMSVELHRQPRAPHSPYPHKVRLVQGPAHFG